MAGKSTYMRQTAIICLMAHMGSFAPADYANIPICDRIFTRVGASDDLSQGQSTFMVEMSEVSHILKNATDKSLVILDEIGRGTSTYDGISLAWSIVEYIEKNIKCKTLFATHYHELTELENEFDEVKNYSIAVKDDGENIIFLRKIIDQAADKSYGIYVAKLAKLPDEVINRSSEILKDLEKNHIYNGYALNKGANNDENANLNKKNMCSNKRNSAFNLELEVKKLEESNLKNEYESLKLEKENLNKTYKKIKKDYDNLNDEYEKLKKELLHSGLKNDNSNNKACEEVAVSMDQISFDIVQDNNILEEIKNIDILSMTPLDAMNALFNLQKKVKNK